MDKKNTLEYNQNSRELKNKYLEMKKHFQNNNLEEDFFTDKFLDIYEDINDKLMNLLLDDSISHSERLQAESFIEKVFQKSFNGAIETIIDLGEGNVETLDHSFFKSGKHSDKINAQQNVSEIKEIDKYNQFLKVYYDLFLGKKNTNIKAYREDIDPDKVRNIPYKLIHVRSGNFSRTLLISDQVGEATFIYDGIIEAGEFKNIKKGGPINGDKGIRVLYRENYTTKLKEILSPEYDFNEDQDDVSQVAKTDKAVLKEELNFYNKQELFKTLWNYEGRSKQGSYNYFMSFLKTQPRSGTTEKIETIDSLKILGKGIKGLKKLSGINIEGSISNPTIFQAWINKVFEGQGIITIQEQVLKALWNYQGRSVQESYDLFMSYGIGNSNTPDSIEGFSVLGRGLKAAMNVSGIEIDTKNNNVYIFQNWINQVFAGQSIEFKIKLTKERLLNELLNYQGRSIQESYNLFMSFGAGDKHIPDSVRGFRIESNGAKECNNILGITLEKSILSIAGFQEWTNKIFEGQDIDFI